MGLRGWAKIPSRLQGQGSSIVGMAMQQRLSGGTFHSRGRHNAGINKVQECQKAQHNAEVDSKD